MSLAGTSRPLQVTSRRDTVVAIAVIVLLGVLTLAIASRGGNRQLPAYYSQSNQPDGARALRLWLAEMNYTVLPDQLQTTLFAPPGKARLVFILEPGLFEDSEVATLDQWVQAGNTLVLAGNQPGALQLASHYQFKATFHEQPLTATRQAAPLLTHPLLPAAFSPETDTSFIAQRSDFVPLLLTPAGLPKPSSLVVTFKLGRGRVLLLSGAYPFTNLGLKQTGSPELVLNLLALADTSGPVWFDEWHHGLRVTEEVLVGPEDWLRYTSSGHAILFVTLVVFLALLLQGRIFGRPVPILRELRRRAPLEYITAIANLGRRAGHRANVLSQYHASLKRGLGRRYRLDPGLPDELYVATLARYNPNLDQQALLTLLTRLSAKSPSETELVRLAAEVSTWLQDLPGGSE